MERERRTRAALQRRAHRRCRKMSILLPADILAWRVDPKASVIDRLIGWGEYNLQEKTPQGYQYYHVAFVAPNTKQMYSAQPPSLNLYPIEDPLPDHIEVYRMIKTPSTEQLSSIFRYAEGRRGTWYDFLGVMTAGFIEIGGLEFCSQYTEDSFANGQIVLASDIRFTTPDDIAGSPYLERKF